MSELPPHYVQRENAESIVGKSPKTIYRHIKKAIESPSKSTAGLLEHCCVQLLDGQIIEGATIKSLNEVDEFRRQGRVPTWHIDADFFSAYFKNQHKSQPAKPVKTSNPNGTDESGSHADMEQGIGPPAPSNLVLEQYQKRIEEKDEIIEELRVDKIELRKQLSANTNLTERITGLLSHSQLAALGLPDGMKGQVNRDPETRPTEVFDGDIVTSAVPSPPPSATTEEDASRKTPTAKKGASVKKRSSQSGGKKRKSKSNVPAEKKGFEKHTPTFHKAAASLSSIFRNKQ